MENDATTFVYLLLFLLAINLTILLHELGHFLVAKRLHLKVDCFVIGLPILRFRLFKWQETTFYFGLIPFMGYVEIDDSPENSDRRHPNRFRQFSRLNPWEYLAFQLGGIAVNLFTAVIFFGLLQLNDFSIRSLLLVPVNGAIATALLISHFPEMMFSVFSSNPAAIVTPISPDLINAWKPVVTALSLTYPGLFCLFVGLFSVVTGLFNLLPIPPLDGGGAFMQILKLLTRHELKRFQIVYNIISVVVMITLIGLSLVTAFLSVLSWLH